MGAGVSVIFAPFLSTPSARRATGFCFWMLEHRIQFLSTPSARRATIGKYVWTDGTQISIHALREEGDSNSEVGMGSVSVFLSTPSARRATDSQQDGCRRVWNFYPRPPRGGRPIRSKMAAGEFGISIHALREEGDQGGASTPGGAQDFYPRPPRGGRLTLVLSMMVSMIFLSTPSARRATSVIFIFDNFR